MREAIKVALIEALKAQDYDLGGGAFVRARDDQRSILIDGDIDLDAVVSAIIAAVSSTNSD